MLIWSRIKVILGATSAFWAASMTPTAMADIIHVPADQPTIAKAADIAQNGDTIIVAAGEYVETANVVIRHSITITGEGGDTFVEGRFRFSGVGAANECHADDIPLNVSIIDMVISEGGIYVNDSVTLTLEDVTIENCVTGLFTAPFRNTSIVATNLKTTNCVLGVVLGEGPSTFSGCQIDGSSNGLRLNHPDCVIVDSDITGGLYAGVTGSPLGDGICYDMFGRVSIDDDSTIDELHRFGFDLLIIDGDTNGDGIVNLTDLLAVIAAWGTTELADLLAVIGNWGTP